MKMVVHRVCLDRIVISPVTGTAQPATATDCLGFANVLPDILDRLVICPVRTLLLELTVSNSVTARLRTLPSVIQRYMQHCTIFYLSFIFVNVEFKPPVRKAIIDVRCQWKIIQTFFLTTLF